MNGCGSDRTIKSKTKWRWRRRRRRVNYIEKFVKGFDFGTLFEDHSHQMLEKKPERERERNGGRRKEILQSLTLSSFGALFI